MATRREFIRLSTAVAASLGALGTPFWSPYREHAQAHAASRPPLITEVPADPNDAERPEIHNLDLGRLLEVGPGTAILRSGYGPRVLTIEPHAEVFIDGEARAFRDGDLRVGDWVEASGETQGDFSLVVTTLRVNSIGNLRGAIAEVSDDLLTVFMKAGRGPAVYAREPVEIRYDERTRFFGGRGNFTSANRTADEVSRGSYVMVNGYRDRNGERVAMEVYLGNELPPPDLPDWLSQELSLN